MSIYILALLIGVMAGLRAMITPAAVSWAAYIWVGCIWKIPGWRSSDTPTHLIS